MTDQQRTGESRPELDKSKIVESSSTVAPVRLPSDGDADVSIAGEPATSKKLTADEQMALYEKELKENDWGHQPC
jgi:hypothetical protein